MVYQANITLNINTDRTLLISIRKPSKSKNILKAIRPLFLDYFTNKYNKILLVGFDNFVVGSQRYYFSPEEINDKLKYLIKNNTIINDGQ